MQSIPLATSEYAELWGWMLAYQETKPASSSQGARRQGQIKMLMKPTTILGTRNEDSKKVVSHLSGKQMSWCTVKSFPGHRGYINLSRLIFLYFLGSENNSCRLHIHAVDVLVPRSLKLHGSTYKTCQEWSLTGASCWAAPGNGLGRCYISGPRSESGCELL